MRCRTGDGETAADNSRRGCRAVRPPAGCLSRTLQIRQRQSKAEAPPLWALSLAMRVASTPELQRKGRHSWTALVMTATRFERHFNGGKGGFFFPGGARAVSQAANSSAVQGGIHALPRQTLAFVRKRLREIDARADGSTIRRPDPRDPLTLDGKTGGARTVGVVAQIGADRVFKIPMESLNPRQRIGAILEATASRSTARNERARIAPPSALKAGLVGLRSRTFWTATRICSRGATPTDRDCRALMLDPKGVGC